MIWSWLKFHNVDQILKSVGKILYIGINQMFVDLYVGLYSTFSFFSAMICKHFFILSLQEDKDNWMKIILSCLHQRFFSSELRQNSILIPKFRQNSILICGSHLPPCFTSCIPTFCPQPTLLTIHLLTNADAYNTCCAAYNIEACHSRQVGATM